MAVMHSSRISAKVFFVSVHACGARTQGTPLPFPTVTAHGSREACVRSSAVELFACRLSLFELSCNRSSSQRELSCNSSFTTRVVSFDLQNIRHPSNAAGYVTPTVPAACRTASLRSVAGVFTRQCVVAITPGVSRVFQPLVSTFSTHSMNST